MQKLNFSVVLIAKNESKTLPRLMESLTEFKTRGGEIILLDTGSNDDTADVARDLGCNVREVGSKFTRTIDQDAADRINIDYVAAREGDIVKAGDQLFDYSSARNFAASLAANDMIAMPDCDEAYTKLDIDKIEEEILAGATQFEYNFVYSHDAEGGDLIKFTHSKFYNRKYLKWVGIIHEVLAEERAPDVEMLKGNRKFMEESVIKLEHWQNTDTNRQHYLKGLALSIMEDPTNDRNLHYFGRELMYSGRYKSAIKVLQQHVALQKWPAERSQSQIHIGECYLSMGNPQKAIHSFVDAFDTNPTRREPLMKIAEYYYRVKSADHVLSYTAAAMQIKGDNFYANYQPYYENVPHEMMYWALWEKGEYNASKRHFDQCFAYLPFKSEYLRDFSKYYEVPKMTLIIDGTSTEAQTNQTIASIEGLNYPAAKKEISFEGDPVENRTGTWTIILPAGTILHPDSVMCAFKQAMDNNKMFMAFEDNETYMINEKLIKKMKEGEIFPQVKALAQMMTCARAKVKKS